VVPTKDTTLTANLAGEKLQPPLWFLRIYPSVLGDKKPEDDVLFDEAWHAPLVFRWPSIGDQAKVSGMLQVWAQTMGFEGSHVLPKLNFHLGEAAFFFEHLKVKGSDLPAWLSLDVPETPMQQLAMIRAHELALAKLADEKKSSGPSGSIVSTG